MAHPPFDYVHYSVPRKGLDDIAEDLGLGRVNDYRLVVLEDDLVVAQITKRILPFLGRSDGPSVLALDQFSLILGLIFESSGKDSASAWHFEPIFVDFETLDFRIERSRRQP